MAHWSDALFEPTSDQSTIDSATPETAAFNREVQRFVQAGLAKFRQVLEVLEKEIGARMRESITHLQALLDAEETAVRAATDLESEDLKRFIEARPDVDPEGLFTGLCCLLQNEDKNIQLVAERLLCAFGPLEESFVYQSVYDVADDESDSDARRRAVRVLGRLAIRSAAAADRLMQVLEHDPDAKVRADAAAALGEFEVAQEERRVALAAAAEKDPNIKVQESAKKSLSKIH
jgi:HEAT repeat protein